VLSTASLPDASGHFLEPIFEADFSQHSYGARPGRSAHDAIGEVRSGLIWRSTWVVDVDLTEEAGERKAGGLVRVDGRPCGVRCWAGSAVR
jgi:hypothetical protein